MTKAIELLGTAVVNGAENLWKHFCAIDYPIERYVIINNSESLFPEVDDVLEKIIHLVNLYKHKYIEEVVVINNYQNTGFAGAVNQIIKQNVDCNYWFITNDDWHIAPGELKKLSQELDKSFTGLLCDGTAANGYSSFVMSEEMISKVGLMDENFYPAYCEDNDHRYRMKLAHLTWKQFPLKASHKVSSTLHSNQKFELSNQKTFHKNIEYYIEKWGGDRGQEIYTTPFNSGAPIDYWPCRLDRIYEQSWF